MSPWLIYHTPAVIELYFSLIPAKAGIVIFTEKNKKAVKDANYS